MLRWASVLVFALACTDANPDVVLDGAVDMIAPAPCSDGVRDGDETDVDCGGPTCAPCANGKMCKSASDCASAMCAGGTCQSPPGLTLAFGPPTPYVMTGGGVFGLAADLDGNGAPDMVVACRGQCAGGNPISLFLNKGAGTFSPAGALGGIGGAASVTVGDFNGDKRLDLAACDPMSPSVAVYLATGGGVFGAPAPVAIGGGNKTCVSVVASDVGGDGKLDLVATTSDGGQKGVVLAQGNGGGGFTMTTMAPLTGLGEWITADDVNRDGRPDLLIALHNGGAGGLQIYLAGGGGLGTAESLATNFPAGGVTVADFNHDTFPDVILGGIGSAHSTNYLPGNGTRANGPPTATYDGTGHAVAADFDLDGTLDLAVLGAIPNVLVLRGNGDGAFATARTMSVGTTPSGVLSADFNGDGKPDLAIVDAASPRVFVILNTSQ